MVACQESVQAKVHSVLERGSGHTSGMQILSCTHKRRDLIDENFRILSSAITMSRGNRIVALFMYCKISIYR